MKKLFLLCVIIGLSSCDAVYQPMQLTKPGMTYDSYRMDIEQCKMQYRADSSAFTIRLLISEETWINECMRRKGYQW